MELVFCKHQILKLPQPEAKNKHPKNNAMHNRQLKYLLLFFSLPFFCNLSVSQTQKTKVQNEARITVMPLHIKIIKKYLENYRVFDQRLAPSNLLEEGLADYEAMYLPVFEKKIFPALKQRRLAVEKILPEAISTEDAEKEAEFNYLIWKSYDSYKIENKRFRKKTAMEMQVEHTGESTKALARYFSEKANTPFLLVTQIRGYHERKIYEERERRDYPTDARGNLYMIGLIVQGRTGKIVADFQVKMSKMDGKFTERKIDTMIEQYVRRLKLEPIL